MDLVLEPDGGRSEQQQQPQRSDRTARDSPGPSTPERAMERQLIQKAEQLERSFADAFSDLRAEDAAAGQEEPQEERRDDTRREVARPRAKAKKVQAKGFGTGRHVETRMGSPPRATGRPSSRGRPAARSKLGSPSRSLASPPKRAKSRSKSRGRNSPAREKKQLLEQIDATRQAGMEELDQRWQRALRLTRDETDSVRNELVAVQGYTLKEHQRRLAEMNAVRDQCARAQDSSREVKEALQQHAERAEQQQTAYFDRLVKLEASVRAATSGSWQRELAAHTQAQGEKHREIGAQMSAVTASVVQLQAKLLSDSTDHRASLGSLEDLTKLAMQQSTTALSQHTTLAAEISLVREQHEAKHSTLTTSLGSLSSQQREDAMTPRGVSADAHAQALEALGDGLRSEMAEMMGLHRLEMTTAAAQSPRDGKRVQDRQTQLLETCDGLRTENIELASSVEQLATLVSSLTERCDQMQSDLQTTAVTVQRLPQEPHYSGAIEFGQLDLRMQTENARMMATIEAYDKKIGERLAETSAELSQRLDLLSERQASSSTAADEGRPASSGLQLGLDIETAAAVESASTTEALVTIGQKHAEQVEEAARLQSEIAAASPRAAAAHEQLKSETQAQAEAQTLLLLEQLEQRVNQRTDECSRECAAKIQTLQDGLTDATMSGSIGEDTSLGLGDMLDEQHRHFTALCAKLEGKITKLALSTQQQQQPKPLDGGQERLDELEARCVELAEQISTAAATSAAAAAAAAPAASAPSPAAPAAAPSVGVSKEEGTRLAARLTALEEASERFGDTAAQLKEALASQSAEQEEKLQGLSTAIAGHYNHFEEMNTELFEACHETETGMSAIGRDCAKICQQQGQRLSLLDQKIARQAAVLQRIATLASTTASRSGKTAGLTAAQRRPEPEPEPELVQPPGGEEFSVTFTKRAALGIKFSPHKPTRSVQVVTVNPGTQAEDHAELKPGLTLIAVAGTSVVGMPYPKVIETIKAQKSRPLTCVFRGSADVSSASSSHAHAAGRERRASLDAEEPVEDVLARADDDAVQEALLREAARLIEWKVGDTVDIDTADGVEKGAVILGPAVGGDAAQMRVKFPDGSVDDWDIEDFLVPRAGAAATATTAGDRDRASGGSAGGGSAAAAAAGATGEAAAVALQHELMQHGTRNVAKINRLRRASQASNSKTDPTLTSSTRKEAEAGGGRSPTAEEAMAAAVAAIDEEAAAGEGEGPDEEGEGEEDDLESLAAQLEADGAADDTTIDLEAMAAALGDDTAAAAGEGMAELDMENLDMDLEAMAAELTADGDDDDDDDDLDLEAMAAALDDDDAD